MYKKYEILEFSKFWNFRRRVWLDACASGHAEPIFGRLGHTTAWVVPGLSKQQIIILTPRIRYSYYYCYSCSVTEKPG